MSECLYYNIKSSLLLLCLRKLQKAKVLVIVMTYCNKDKEVIKTSDSPVVCPTFLSKWGSKFGVFGKEQSGY